ncbi:hypothetical protein [Vibrio sp. D431a]|uniref:hypothetical protein n=1 Tax=Vibrio sp. D431a TaxID=2837388 RepID=UPI0025562939|nr:hypothetical protein [Vibrio sp. D431a]MDK9793346.1 hypothetical protein [Vibrio sp. D431a]
MQKLDFKTLISSIDKNTPAKLLEYAKQNPLKAIPVAAVVALTPVVLLSGGGISPDEDKVEAQIIADYKDTNVIPHVESLSIGDCEQNSKNSYTCLVSASIEFESKKNGEIVVASEIEDAKVTYKYLNEEFQNVRVTHYLSKKALNDVGSYIVFGSI